MIIVQERLQLKHIDLVPSFKSPEQGLLIQKEYSYSYILKGHIQTKTLEIS